MSSVAEIEAALQKLSSDELAHVEQVLLRLRAEEAWERRFDGRRWPATAPERDALLVELDGLPPLLAEEEADRFDAWRAAERERQKTLMKMAEPGSLFA